MWTRAELKEKARRTFKANYWKAVLVALLVAVVVGGASIMPSFTFSSAFAGQRGLENYSFNADSLHVETSESADLNGIYEALEAGEYADIQSILNGVEGDSIGGLTFNFDEDGFDLQLGSPESGVNLNLDGSATVGTPRSAEATLLLTAIIFPIVMLATIILIAVGVFILNPLEVGFKRFFLCNLNEQAQVKETAYAFDNNYLTIVKTMFFRDLFTVLWGLLFIIPGIVKSYEYRMIPYLLAENPSMTQDEAFAQSKRMMDGQKWKAFVLDLSFIGWFLLSAITLGFLSVFYVDPYKNQTDAALYEKLRYKLAGQNVATAGAHFTAAPYDGMTMSASDIPLVPFAQDEPEA